MKRTVSSLPARVQIYSSIKVEEVQTFVQRGSGDKEENGLPPASHSVSRRRTVVRRSVPGVKKTRDPLPSEERC